jgi:hypothetical protein
MVKLLPKEQAVNEAKIIQLQAGQMHCVKWKKQPRRVDIGNTSATAFLTATSKSSMTVSGFKTKSLSSIVSFSSVKNRVEPDYLYLLQMTISRN